MVCLPVFAAFLPLPLCALEEAPKHARLEAAPPPLAAPAPVAMPCPVNFKSADAATVELTCRCSPAAIMAGPVWGSDVYTADSSVCRAALHAGAVGPTGGLVTVLRETGRPAYAGTQRNGVASDRWGGYEASFRFAGVRTAPARTGAASVSPCPADFREVAATAHSLTCACTPEAASDGSVWGSDVYTADSRICRAALHAGAVGQAGGTVTVVGMPGRPSYRGTSRNGVASDGWGTFETSYRFAMTAAAPGSSLLPDCPENLAGTAAVSQPLACVCAAAATQSGNVWGTDVYTADSRICRAAVHAGATGPRGGTVIVVPAPGRPSYEGSARNGVASDGWGAFETSYRFASTAAGGDATPVDPQR